MFDSVISTTLRVVAAASSMAGLSQVMADFNAISDDFAGDRRMDRQGFNGFVQDPC